MQKCLYFFIKSFYFLYSKFIMQNMPYPKHQPNKKRYKQLVILQKYMHIQRQIQENSVRLFQKFHGKSQKHRSLNPSSQQSRKISKERIRTPDIISECGHQDSGESTFRHVNTNRTVLNSVREILKDDKSLKKLPSHILNPYQMMTDQKEANLQQNQLKEHKKKVRHTYNIFSKYNSSFQRSFRLFLFKGQQELKTPTIKESTVRVKISMLKKDKWNVISKKPIDDTDVLLVKSSPVAFNADQMKQPVKLKRNYSNMYQIYCLNQHRKKEQNGKIEDIQDDALSTGRIEPWNDQNS